MSIARNPVCKLKSSIINCKKRLSAKHQFPFSKMNTSLVVHNKRGSFNVDNFEELVLPSLGDNCRQLRHLQCSLLVIKLSDAKTNLSIILGFSGKAPTSTVDYTHLKGYSRPQNNFRLKGSIWTIIEGKRHKNYKRKK